MTPEERKAESRRANKLRNEGMLIDRGWTRLSEKLPDNNSNDSEYLYASKQCLFIVNKDGCSMGNTEAVLGIIFGEMGGSEELHLTCGGWAGDSGRLNLCEDYIQTDVFWKEIDTPNLISLDE